jgi:hypothetical protein
LRRSIGVTALVKTDCHGSKQKGAKAGLMAIRDEMESMMDASREIKKELLMARIVELDAWIESRCRA